ncbi:hypothetical protein MJG53_018366, partial [Ovis ammon polii x Ovis aries]
IRPEKGKLLHLPSFLQRRDPVGRAVSISSVCHGATPSLLLALDLVRLSNRRRYKPPPTTTPSKGECRSDGKVEALSSGSLPRVTGSRIRVQAVWPSDLKPIVALGKKKKAKEKRKKHGLCVSRAPGPVQLQPQSDLKGCSRKMIQNSRDGLGISSEKNSSSENIRNIWFARVSCILYSFSDTSSDEYYSSLGEKRWLHEDGKQQHQLHTHVQKDLGPRFRGLGFCIGKQQGLGASLQGPVLISPFPETAAAPPSAFQL